MCHSLPYFCDPEKKERVRTKGLSFPLDRCISPSAVAICYKDKGEKNFKGMIRLEHCADIPNKLLDMQKLNRWECKMGNMKINPPNNFHDVMKLL